MKDICVKIVDSPYFKHTVTGVILFAGVLVGIETYPHLVQRYGPVLHALDALVLAIFTLEIVVKMAAHGNRPWLYFKDPWNVFDFVIVAACFLPLNGKYIVVLRLARLLRVLKLVRALPRLQLLVTALLKSIPSMGYISVFLFLLIYIYAVTATFIFGENDPVHFDTLPKSMLSLFRVVTLEDWTDIMYIQMYGCANYGYVGTQTAALCTKSSAFPILSPLFFSSFVLIGTMVIMNLFIGVIMNGMEEARNELEGQKEKDRLQARGLTEPSLEHSLFELRNHLGKLEKEVSYIQKIARERGWTGPSEGGPSS